MKDKVTLLSSLNFCWRGVKAVLIRPVRAKRGTLGRDGKR